MGRGRRVELYIGLQRKFRYLYIVVVIVVASFIIKGTLGYLEDEGLMYLIEGITEGNFLEKMIADAMG